MTAEDNGKNIKKLRLADYRPPEFTTGHVDLDFRIDEGSTTVVSKATYQRKDPGAAALVLDAENPNKNLQYIQRVTVDGVDLAEGYGYTYDRENDKIEILLDPSQQQVEVEIETLLEPDENSKLTGLYHSGDRDKKNDCLVTQCESLGFRRITAFTDRPDVLSTYRVKIDAPKDLCPVLLANGNMVDSGDSGNGRHYAVFVDPNPKPCYLFATANGRLEAIKGNFVTREGRNVELAVWTEPGKSEMGRHALDSLAQFLQWDEDVFDAVYDLDKFHIVTVEQFTFGAMENTSLNVFRDILVLTSAETATDDNYLRSAVVVGHEAAHKKSGNDVTLANFFNISLKEGLTVVREQMFTAFITSDAYERIGAVQTLRGKQFGEDDSPIVHAVLPQEVNSIENCYSSTIYQKGAEVIRMMRVRMGDETFIDAVKHYFKKHHGQAVTIEDFVKCMEEKSGLDFSGEFFRWYTQSGRPRVTAEGHYDAAAQTYTLTLEQQTPPTKDQPDKKAQVMPVVMGLVDADGNDMPLFLDGDAAGEPDAGATQRIIEFSKGKQTFVFKNVAKEPAFHSLFRGFSAPIDLEPGLTQAQLLQQMTNDSDGFNRWDAGQKLALQEMARLYDSYKTTGAMPAVDAKYLMRYGELVRDRQMDPAVLALTLKLPSIAEFERRIAPADAQAVAAVNAHLRETISRTFYNDFFNILVRTHDTGPYKFDYESMGKRSLKALAVGYIMEQKNAFSLNAARRLYNDATNMTDTMMAMSGVRNHTGLLRDVILGHFFNRFKDDSLVIQKWFQTVAMSNYGDVLDELRDIVKSNVFNWKNPGHLSSLVGGFAANYEQFHRLDGKGYEFVADCVLKEDGINSAIAARLVEPLCSWRKYEPKNAALMIEQLERIAASPDLSKDTKDKVIKSLPNEEERQKMSLTAGAALAPALAP